MKKLLLPVVLLITLSLNAQHYQGYGSIVAGQKSCTSGDDSAHFHGPTGIYGDNTKHIYVCDAYNGRVEKWAEGATFGDTAAGHSHLIYSGLDSTSLGAPYGVFVDSAGTVYVASTFNTITKWAKGVHYGIVVAGNKSFTGGSDSSHLSFPVGVFVDKSGNVYVGDNANNRVQKWAPGAKYGVTVAGQADGTSGTDSSHLNGPNGVYVDKYGNVFVADGSNNRVQKWAAGAKYGVTVAGTGTAGKDADQLNLPEHIFVDNTGNLFIADYLNGRVQEWKPGAKKGITVAGHRDASLGADSTYLSGPFGIWLDSHGDIFVSEAGLNRVRKWAIDTTASTSIKEVALTLSKLNLFPNPVNNSLHIYLPKSITQGTLKLINIMGQEVASIEMNTNSAILDMSKWAPGVYEVRLQSVQGVFTTQVVKQ